MSENRLKNEKSSYLLQHKDNPVHWWAYSKEALQKAKDENKPIFLSVGYSSCHWCHVMAHESFEDQATADFLNKNFVCIKVDKEEHPDVDNYYQQACQLFVQTGGWPLNAFLLPDSRPFFVGTYFPKTAQAGTGTTFMELITELNRAYKEDKDKIEENAKGVTAALSQGLPEQEKVDFPDHFPPPAAVMAAVSQFADKDNGGYGAAPKFPQFTFYEFAIEQMLEGMVEQEQGQHIIETLEKMLMGGIFDHARGGIHRYSVDEKWQVPHFEKMLYDQAGLIRLLSKFGLLYPSPLVFDALINTLNYLEAEMLSEKSFFFSAQDADSEGEEGLYFTFSKEEFESAVNKASDENDNLTSKMDDLIKWFNITDSGTFEKGLNVVCLDPAYRKEIFTPESWELVRAVRDALLNERKERIPPATDNKGVASWNFMLISSLVDVMQYCQIDVIKKMASGLFNKALEGMYNNFLQGKDNKTMSLRHTTTKETGLPYLEDYVNFAECQLRVYEISANPVFKQNFKDTMEFIEKEFIDGDKVLTRAKSANDAQDFPNQSTLPFDSSYKSSLSTLIALSRRGRVLFQEPNFLSVMEPIIESTKHLVLKNPLAAGEALRANVYPDGAYRVIKAPKEWLENEEYLKFIAYFLPRFVLDHSETDGNWQICNMTSCELNGTGLESFMEKLKPKNAPESEQE